ncbi:hypothetical protein [Gloeothece verrucosa]|uniref:Uncharacterized protein n=1 Tax=Gloeothece verrucosa (strain PCC 7822) TaxID=497965 RepID=E0UCC1_GLOV7|nr:hypothetical protein [Gloeothece verrucosa]ADN12878.1 hypothetical protein Cyan7822_0858 [Gloeothece verrucosa PCC 7822]
MFYRKISAIAILLILFAGGSEVVAAFNHEPSAIVTAALAVLTLGFVTFINMFSSSKRENPLGEEAYRLCKKNI